MAYSPRDETIWLLDNEVLMKMDIKTKTPLKTFDFPTTKSKQNFNIDLIGNFMYHTDGGRKLFQKSLSTWEQKSFLLYENDEVITGISLESINNKILYFSTVTGGIHSIELSNNNETMQVNKDIIPRNCNLKGPFLSEFQAFDRKLYFVELETSAIWIFDSESCLRKGSIPKDHQG